MTDAVDYENSILAVDRSASQAYYYGLSPTIGAATAPYIGEDPNATLGEILDKDDQDVPNRSTYVSTDVRDAVMMMLPSLIRLFGASESPVYLVPRNQAEVNVAEQATDYVNYTFWNDNPGFLILHGAFKDALTVKTGFVKWWTDDTREKQRKTFANITADQIQLILSDDSDARVLRIGRPVPPSAPADPSMPPTSPTPPVYDEVVIEFEVSKPLVKIAGVPPEEMRIDRYARSFKDSRQRLRPRNLCRKYPIGRVDLHS